MELTTVGVSPRGVIAALLASELNVSRCFCFRGQYSIKNHFNHSAANPFICKYYNGEISNDGWCFESYNL